MRSVICAVCAATIAAACLMAQTESDFQQDFDVALRRIGNTYAYFDTKATRWSELPSLYAADIRDVKTRDAFIALLERVVDELYDPHAQLTVNLAGSPRLVPSGTDLWAEWKDGRATSRPRSTHCHPRSVKPESVEAGWSSYPRALYHANGTPREEFQPAVPVDVARAPPGVDPFIDGALQALTPR